MVHNRQLQDYSLMASADILSEEGKIEIAAYAGISAIQEGSDVRTALARTYSVANDYGVIFPLDAYLRSRLAQRATELAVGDLLLKYQY